MLSNRSRAYLVLESRQEALKDAQDCCVLKPLWNKVRAQHMGCLDGEGSTHGVPGW